MTHKYCAVLLLLTAVACNKPLPEQQAGPFDYSVSNIKDIAIPANDSVTFYSYVQLTSGDAASQPVTVHFTGLPVNVHAAQDSFTFLLNNRPEHTLVARNATPGSYAVQAVFTNAATSTRTYSFTLTVGPPLDRLALVCGYYYPSNNCDNVIYVSCEIDSIPGSPGKIMLIDRKSKDGSYGTFDTCYGYVDCCANTFTVPDQKAGNTTVAGYGNASVNGSILYHKTTITDTATYNCVVTLSK